MTEPDPSRRVALAAVTMAVTAWAFGPIIVRGAGVSTATFAFWRLSFGAPLMIAFAYLTRGRLSWSLLKTTLFPGLLFGTSMVASFASFQETSIANATLIGALMPALLLFVAPRLFGDSSSVRQRVLAGAAFVGMAVVVLASGETSGAHWTGDVYALVNLVLWTTYFIVVKRVRDAGVHGGSFLACVFVVSAIIVCPWAIAVSDDLGSLDLRGYALVFLMALGPGVLGHSLMVWAQRHLDITIASLITLLHPVLSGVAAWLIYSERLNALQLAGGVVVLAALGAIMREVRQASPEVQEALPVSAD